MQTVRTNFSKKIFFHPFIIHKNKAYGRKNDALLMIFLPKIFFGSFV